MKAKLLTLILLLPSSLLLLNAQTEEKKTVKAKMQSATVFFQGAELTHTASYLLAKGENEIYIEGLSPTIDKNSLKIKASNGVIISASEFSVDYLVDKKKNVRNKRLDDSIKYYEDLYGKVDTDLKITNNLLTLLQKGTDKNVSGSEKGLGIDELVKTMDYYKLKSTELQTQQSTLNNKKAELDRAIDRLEKQRDQESLKNDKTMGILRLNVSSPLAVTATFTVSYYTTSAGWTPYYDINIASTNKPIKIQSKSKVRQTTGLDWDRVKLTLSTSTPSNGKTAPLFRTWFLKPILPTAPLGIGSALQGRTSGVNIAQNAYSYDEYQNQELEETVVIRGSRTHKKESATPLYIVDGVEVDAGYFNSLSPDMIKDVSILKDASSTAVYGSRGSNGVVMITTKGMGDYVSQSENELNMSFAIDLPYTIPGNGKEQAIDLSTKEIKAEYKYYCAPKLDKETYLLAEISGWEELNLLSGKANITYDGTYVGESYIDARSTQQKLALTLGTDKRVSVKREKLQDYSSKKTLSNNIEQVFTYRLTVRNNQNKTIKMVLKDQYPISMQKNIDVKLLTKDTTPWTANKEDLGVISWEEDLKAGETKVYQISYEVKYPKESNLNL
ncbi:DUF4139 domain-containing protein [Dysgonomonas sp. 511]|uniref:DUF4139 domain-containing protein n=1 Tax=Dysgonomonas sp. 511 TaxID=2302930 RepID=UPI0013D28049|nr:DUF4139 domain-containing protein [Dysgonomonas sp. 511]NDV77427.1 mucoidy inhibitor MuiA family protein [Dysgonomonas sp. 511]